MNRSRRSEFGRSCAGLLALAALACEGEPGPVCGADVMNDRFHCGACGNACPLDDECSQGQCVAGCSRTPIAGGRSAIGGALDGIDTSLMRVRAPQCAGVIYAEDDPASAEAAARAVTVGVELRSTCDPGDEPCTPELAVGQVNPMLLGVLDGVGVCATGNEAQRWQEEHPEVGYALIGVDIGACSSSCDELLGQRCEGDRCRQYPLLPAGSAPVFAGVNFWDGLRAHLLFTRLDDANDVTSVPAQVDVDGVPLMPLPDEAEQRCALEAEIDRGYAERRVERLVTPGGPRLLTGHFYRVQVQNVNGTYYHWGERVPLGLDERDENGRTIHLCIPPDCQSIPDPDLAACADLLELQTCGPEIGGSWSRPPRSLAHCKQLSDATSDPEPCPETPLSFLSDAMLQGLPLLLYMADPG